MKKKLFYILITGFISLTLLSGALAAEKYPSKEIQLIVANPPGGFNDISIRLMKDNLEKNLGVPIVVNNRTGAGGATGINFLVKSKPDGYTIGSASSADLVVLPLMVPSVPFKYSDLDPLCKFVIAPNVIFCRADAPWKSIEDLVSDAKKRPGKITYAGTPKGASDLNRMGFQKTAGIDMLHVPTEAAGQTITRVLGGNLDVGMVALSPLIAQIQAGTARALLITSPERVKNFPQIPTMKEKGFGDPVIDVYSGFFVPLGVPKTIKETLEKALEKTIKDPTVKERLEEQVLVLDYLPAEAFAKELQKHNRGIIEILKTPGAK